ncbi:MAG: type II secretion system secretin GspD [Polyangiaceae bacterium]
MARSSRLFIALSLVISFAMPARAELPVGEGVGELKPKSPNDHVMLQLEDADLGELVHSISAMTGKRFVIATKNKGFKASIVSAQKITVSEAYQAFLAVLQANGLTVVPESGFLKIIDSQDVAKQNTPVAAGVTNEERYITELRRVSHGSAEDLAAVLTKFQTRDGSIVPVGSLLIVTDTGTNMRRLLRILEDIDVGGTVDKIYFEPVHYVASVDLEKKLSEIVDWKGDKKSSPVGDSELHVSKIIAVERPNALVIVATEESYRRVLELVERIDVPASREGQMNIVALQHADAKKLVGPINDAISGATAGAQTTPGKGAAASAFTILEAPVKVSAEESSNSLIVTASPRDFASIRQVIAKLDQPKRQVFIEAVVMDVSLDRETDLGVAFHGADALASSKGNTLLYGGLNPLKSALPPSATDPSLQAFVLGVRTPDVATGIPGLSTIPGLGAFITAAATSNGADILSTPSIMASDNTPAEIKVQLKTSLQPHAPQVPTINTGSANPLSGFQTGTSASQNYQAIGPRIKVTPHLNDSDEVRLEVEELISDIVSAPAKDDVYGTVSYVERAATTTLTVKDQQTVVIGGLVRNRTSRRETKVPLLGDIPVLGALFRSSSDQIEKSNLVLILTPYIIRDQSDLRTIFERKMEERQDMIDHATVFSDSSYTPPKDYTRTHGVLTEVRTRYREVDEKKALDAQSKPPAVQGHDAQTPTELPVNPATPTWGGAAVAPAAPTKATVREIEK